MFLEKRRAMPLKRICLILMVRREKEREIRIDINVGSAGLGAFHLPAEFTQKM